MDKSLFFVGVVALLAALATAAEIEDCTDNDELGEFVEASVSGCTAEDEKCPLLRGHNVTISFKFTTKKEIKSVQHVVHGILPAIPVPVPFPLDSPDACVNTGLQCPLPVGKHSYSYGLFVKPSYPKLSVHVKWELLNEDKKQIVCIKVPSKLK